MAYNEHLCLKIKLHTLHKSGNTGETKMMFSDEIVKSVYGCQLFSAKHYVLLYQIAIKNAKAFLRTDNGTHFKPLRLES